MKETTQEQYLLPLLEIPLSSTSVRGERVSFHVKQLRQFHYLSPRNNFFPLRIDTILEELCHSGKQQEVTIVVNH